MPAHIDIATPLITNADAHLLDPTDHGSWNLKKIRITDPFRMSKSIQILSFFFHRSCQLRMLNVSRITLYIIIYSDTYVGIYIIYVLFFAT